jgi:hypothetical protein
MVEDSCINFLLTRDRQSVRESCSAAFTNLQKRVHDRGQGIFCSVNNCKYFMKLLCCVRMYHQTGCSYS